MGQRIELVCSRSVFDLDGLLKQEKQFEEVMAGPGFWDNRNKALEVIAELKKVQNWTAPLTGLSIKADDLAAAVELLALEDDIHRMPLGYDTLIGQGISDVLPAGMIQRIVIARALALKPTILLFNEANSMLDMRSDSALKQAFASLKGKMTIVIISNRPSLLAIADQQFILKDATLQARDETAERNQEPPAQAKRVSAS